MMNTIRISRLIPLWLLYSLSAWLPVTSSGQGLEALQLTGLNAQSRNGNVSLSWKTLSEQGLVQFEVECSTDGRYYQDLGFIPARNNLAGDLYEWENPVTYTDSAFYRLKIVDMNGNWLYTDPVLYHVNNRTAFFVYPSVISNSVMNLFLHEPFYSLEVIGTNGVVMLKQNLGGETGRINVPISPLLSAGVYIVLLKNYNRTISQKIVIQQ
jgi:hypothetical protein